MKKGIDTFTLKIIAVITMLIDHIGAVLFPQYLSLRIIGRIAFPIYAYTLVEGFIYTRDVKKYLIRLGILALISEIPFDLAFYHTIFEFEHQNVFFTLFLGILMLYFIRKELNTVSNILCVVLIFLVSEILCTDYSSMGLLMVLCFYQMRNQKILKYLGIAFINVFLMGYLQEYAVLALLPIALHNGVEGPKNKRFFYGFYPVHLVILYLISILL